MNDLVFDALAVGRCVGFWEIMPREVMERDYPHMRKEDVRARHFMFGILLMDYVLAEYSRTTLVKFPAEKNIAKALAKVYGNYRVSGKARRIYDSLLQRKKEIFTGPIKTQTLLNC
jgi:hypothetical protein